MARFSFSKGARGTRRGEGGLVRRSAKREGGTAKRAGGFTLVEVLVCTLILTTGLLAIAGLLAITTRMHFGAREAARATRLAQDKIDELMKLDFDTDAEVGVCADPNACLTTNVANHFEADAAGGVTIRWAVEAHDSGNADLRVLTVRVDNSQRSRLYGQQVELTTIIRNW
ncbi:MAG: prepilin-type N-terminal cleavage/methylation domain-containing protein [Acidobacteria bacterium]|nr:prepilin-type N-terminal cleavage/methylation domain-containing protein [Acidobacteriota bacterium]